MAATFARYWKDLGAVFTGAATAQLVPVAASLLIVRLLLPLEYGLYAAWLAIVVLLASVVGLRLEAAIPLASGTPAKLVALLAVLGVIVVTGMAAALVMLLGLLTGFALPVGVGMLLLGLATAMLLAASSAFQYWLGAEGLFGALSRLRILQAVGVSGGQIAAAAAFRSGEALAAAYAAGVALAIACAATGPLRRCRAAVALPPGACRAFVRSRSRFVTVALPSAALGTASEQLPVLLVGARFGAEAAGYLAIAARTLGAPVGLAVSVVADVFRRDATAEFEAHGRCSGAFDRAVRLLVLGTAALVLVAPWFDAMFTLAFGPRWAVAGTTATWLVPLFALRLIASPVSYAYFVAERPGLDLAWQSVLLVFVASAFVVPGAYATAVRGYAWGYAALYLLYLYGSFRLSRGRREPGGSLPR